MISENDKKNIKRDLVSCLKTEKEIRRIVIFGSFLKSLDPHDLDVAVFQDSDEKYLPLAMKYRKKIRDVSGRIPVDVFPLKIASEGGFFMDEIRSGEVIYERRN